MILILLLIFVWTMSFYMDTTIFGLSTSNPLGVLTFSFVHQNLLHLVINSVMLYWYWIHIRHLRRFRVIMIIAISTIMSGLLSMQDVPTIGASAIVLSMAGIIVCRMRDYDNMMATMVLSSVLLGISYLMIPNLNFAIHFYSLWISFLLGLFVSKCLR